MRTVGAILLFIGRFVLQISMAMARLTFVHAGIRGSFVGHRKGHPSGLQRLYFRCRTKKVTPMTAVKMVLMLICHLFDSAISMVIRKTTFVRVLRTVLNVISPMAMVLIKKFRFMIWGTVLVGKNRIIPRRFAWPMSTGMVRWMSVHEVITMSIAGLATQEV